MQTVIVVHSGKHLSDGKTTIVYSINNVKLSIPDCDVAAPDGFKVSLQDIAIHFAILSGLARSEDYNIETGEDDIKRPVFIKPKFAELFKMTGFAIDKKGVLNLNCTWHGTRTTPSTMTVNGINTSFESKNGYEFLQDLNALLAMFRFHCTKYVEMVNNGEFPIVEKKAPVKKSNEPEIPFGTNPGTDVTKEYIGPGGVLENATGGGVVNEESEPLENFQKDTARTADQKPVPLKAVKPEKKE